MPPQLVRRDWESISSRIHFDMLQTWTVYLRNGIVFIPASANAGYFLQIDPVATVPVGDRLGIIAAIKSTIAKGNPKHRPYLRRHFPPPVVLKPAGVKTWTAFEKGALCWSIKLRDGIFQICPKKDNPEGGWLDDPTKAEELPPGTSVDAVAEKVSEQTMHAAKQIA